jgi:2-polyprenyl-3-methyl-5-hydroxy-6-metoxy-1,4-benzoquinol methylase
VKVLARLCLIVIGCGLAAAQPEPTTDDVIWEEYVKWVAALPALPPGQHANGEDVYIKAYTARGVSASEAKRRWDRINVLRRGSPDREKIYWDHSFKLGGGPSDPLRILQESIRKVRPGKALDPGMGRGRNAIWLASMGWDVIGYDISADALNVAQAYAQKAGVRIKTVLSSHEKFDFGESQYDLIVCGYNFMDIMDPKLPAVLSRTLKPKGIVVWQTFLGPNHANLSAAKILDNWKQFHLIRFDDLDAGVVDDDWAPSRNFRTIRLVVRKEE